MDDYDDGYDELLHFEESLKLTIQNFNKWELGSQVFTLMYSGTFLGTAVFQEYYVRFYSLENFYACLYYHLKEDRVSHCYAFDDPAELDPLWDELDMDAFVLKKE